MAQALRSYRLRGWALMAGCAVLTGLCFSLPSPSSNITGYAVVLWAIVRDKSRPLRAGQAVHDRSLYGVFLALCVVTAMLWAEVFWERRAARVAGEGPDAPAALEWQVAEPP